MSPPGGNAATPLGAPGTALRRAELRAADAVGALVELWGFKRQMGRVWTVLYLSERPLTAAEACDRLGISTGLLSMTLGELRAWGAVRTLNAAGERRERYEAETAVWRIVLRVLGTRERAALDEALSAFADALAEVRSALLDADPVVRAAARFRSGRLSRLVAHTRGAAGLLRVLSEAIAGGRRGPGSTPG
jgi:DNA-binding transcriptional regulator GbsR (MarR family)